MLGNVLGLLVGFMLGVLIRNSPGAIVAYFVYSFVRRRSPSSGREPEWFKDLRPWVDFNFAQGGLFNGEMAGDQWANLAIAGTIWLVLPMIVGLVLVRRSEVK